MTTPADGSYEHGDGGRGPENFDPVENLLGDDPDEVMQTGYNPPDREPHSLKDLTTAADQLSGQSVDDYLAQEEPEVTTADATAGPADPRAGRLVTSEENLAHDVVPDGVATDVGPAGYASSAEEAAVHIVAEPDDERS